MINESFVGQGNYFYPQINSAHNEALLLAIEQAGVRIGTKGFEKDKSGGKYAETEEYLLQSVLHQRCRRLVYSFHWHEQIYPPIGIDVWVGINDEIKAILF